MQDCTNVHLRPYARENTASRSICEVKQGQARLVLRWGTTWEVQVLNIFLFWFCSPFARRVLLCAGRCLCFFCACVGVRIDR